jgi:alpha-mannosidase
VEQVATKEIGPERAALWVRLAGGDSRLDLTLTLSRGRDAVDVRARVLWNERAARLKLVFPGVADSGEAEFDVPGGSARRGACGEVPGGRWVRCHSARSGFPFGFASDALYGFDLTDDGALRASVVRASGYSQAEKSTPDDAPWHPVVDAGELRFRFLLTGDDERLPILARELEEPPVALLVPPSRGDWPRSGSLGALSPPTMRLLALKPAEDGNGWIVRVQETAGVATEPTLTWLGRELALGTLPAEGIATWRLLRAAGDDSWQAEPTNLVEGAEDPNRRERRP